MQIDGLLSPHLYPRFVTFIVTLDPHFFPEIKLLIFNVLYSLLSRGSVTVLQTTRTIRPLTEM